MTEQLDTENVRSQLSVLNESLQYLASAMLPLNLTGNSSSLTNYCISEDFEPIAKAKMLVTVGYAIDSLLFCYLKVTNTDTENHTIMGELARIKQYVDKIKAANGKRQAILNKTAANRVIAHDLAGNAAIDRQRSISTAQMNQRLQEKLASLGPGRHTRFTNSGMTDDTTKPEDVVDDSILAVHDDDQDDAVQILEGTQTDAMTKSKKKKKKMEKLRESEEERQETTSVVDPPSSGKMFEESREERKNRERRERRAAKKDRMRKKKEKIAATAE